jgi:serine/threonine-protein kinase
MNKTIGHYRLIRLLATGGMGEVFLAQEQKPNAPFLVVKRILRHLARDQGFVDLFVAEARLAMRIQHPNVVAVHALEQAAGDCFIAMEFVDGFSLRQLIKAARERGLLIPHRIAVRMIAQALLGLHAAHELRDEQDNFLGILHGDISPENLLISREGPVKLADFGIARARKADETSGRLKGKLAYLAPELVAGGHGDRRADLFSMGVVLHETLTLDSPAIGTGEYERHPRAFAMDARVPGALAQLARRALSNDPVARFATALEMSLALDKWLETNRQPANDRDVRDFLEVVFGPPATLFDEASPTTAVLTRPAAAVAAIPTLIPESRRTDPAIRVNAGHAPQPEPAQVSPWLVPLLAGGATAFFLAAILVVAVWPAQKPAKVPTANGALADTEALGTADDAADGASSGRLMPELDLLSGANGGIDSGLAVEVESADHDGGARAASSRLLSQGNLEADAGLEEDGDGPAREVATPDPKKKPPLARRGHVRFRVPAGTEIFLGTKSLGTAPFRTVETPVGQLTFTLKNRRLGVVRKISVHVGPTKLVVVQNDLRK